MFGKKKSTHDNQPNQATVGSMPKRRKLRDRFSPLTSTIGGVVKRHIILTVLLGLALIGSGIFLALQQQKSSEEPALTGLGYDAAYRKQLMTESGHSADYGDYLILGKQALEQKDYKTAEGYFKDAEKQKAEDVDVLYALATVYRLLEDKTRSLEYYTKVITLAGPQDSSYHANLKLYEAEKRAIETGNFSLDGVMPEGFNAL